MLVNGFDLLRATELLGLSPWCLMDDVSLENGMSLVFRQVVLDHTQKNVVAGTTTICNLEY